MLWSDFPTPGATKVAEYGQFVDDLIWTLEDARVFDDPAALKAQLIQAFRPSAGGQTLSNDATRLPRLIAQSLEIARTFSSGPGTTAETRSEALKVLFLQQIELTWWSHTPDYPDEEAVVRSEEFVHLDWARRTGQVRFGFRLQSDHFVPLARNYLERRWIPRHGPGTPGLSCPYIRPEMIRFLNVLADEWTERVGTSAPFFWVNSVTRTIVQQKQLQTLGFTAHDPSVHCRGWAADIEMKWLEQFDMRSSLESMLQAHHRRGSINLIDEGRIWHISPNPQTVADICSGSDDAVRVLI
jgi:Family of unknown function (DUF5715)